MTIFVKDELRASVEAASGGKMTVLYTAKGAPSYVVPIPKFSKQDIDASLGTGVHDAFIVGGVEKSEIFIGAYPGILKDGELLSLPGVEPTGGRNHDTFVADARACGAGWHLTSNAEYAALQLWCWKNGFLPRGNSNYGRSSDNTWEAGRRADGIAPGTASGTARTLTGSGPASWRHDNTPTGISDLCGNVNEWTPGLRIVEGEIQVIANNNAALNATDFGPTSTEWKAIDAVTGALITPTFTGSIAGSNYVPTTTNSVRYATSGTANYSLVRSSGGAFEGMTNPGGSPVAAPALERLKSLGLFPVDASLGGDYMYLDVTGERLPSRGGYWIYGAGAGVFCLHLYYARSSTGASLGARPAFVL